MKNFHKNLLLAMGLVFAMPCMAQNAEMADGLRSEGKIYVLVIMILVVLFGLIGFLFFTDRKLSRLEKKVEGAAKTKSGTNSLS